MLRGDVGAGAQGRGGRRVAERGEALPAALIPWNFTARGAVSATAILGAAGCK